MTREIKNLIFKNITTVTKALASPIRLEIIDLLSQGEKTVEMIAEQTDQGVKNTSAQLKELRNANLVITRRDGKFIYYRLIDKSVAQFWIGFRSFAEERMVELQIIVNDVFTVPGPLEELNRKQLIQRAKKGEIVLIDVRPLDEYETAHLPFAISIPKNEISKHLTALPKSKEIVAYCRGPHCFLAKDAVEELRKRGYKATRLSDGVQEWVFRGFPIEGQNSI